MPPGDVLWQPADQWKVEVGFAGLFSSLSPSKKMEQLGNWTDGKERMIRQDKCHST